MPRKHRNENQKHQAAASATTKLKPTMAPPVAAVSQARLVKNNYSFTHDVLNTSTDVGVDYADEFSDENESNTNESLSDSEESSAAETVKSTRSADAREVFDEMPDSGVRDVKLSEAPWTCYAKLHSVPVQGNRVKLETNHLDDVDATWGFCLVGRFATGFPRGLEQLCASWDVPCEVITHANNTGWAVFKFEDEQDREHVLLEGPYSVSGRTLFLKHMPPCFEFDADPLKSIPVWIKLPGLPLDCWNPTALSMIASAVGKPIATDKRTLTKERISHARLLVEVDVTVELVNSIEIHLPNGTVRQQEVKFDFLPIHCEGCYRRGHSPQSCPSS